MYVESGSSVVLRCHISDWLQKPQIVFWYETIDERERGGELLVEWCDASYIDDEMWLRRRFKDGQRIATSPSGDTEVETSLDGRHDSIDSRLTIARAAAARHSGTYECSTDNIKPARINLHVVEGEERVHCLKVTVRASQNGAH